jgi:predicted short-subunit dehydrogenase-like oxidoreductase (DUF2520 family)
MLGAGHVATVLAKQTTLAGHTIIQVYSRQWEKAHQLASQTGAYAIDRFEQIAENADLYIVALADAGVEQLAQSWKTNHGLVVHTAGALPMEALAGVSPHYGVLYPLQSLRASLPIPSHIPWLIDANTLENKETLWAFAKSLGGTVAIVGNEARLRLHVAAVIVNNFGNHLLHLAEIFCQQEGIDFGLLYPIIAETTHRLQFAPPSAVQTGPAIRRDNQTIQTHLALLKNHDALLHLYQTFTSSIQQLN